MVIFKEKKLISTGPMPPHCWAVDLVYEGKSMEKIEKLKTKSFFTTNFIKIRIIFLFLKNSRAYF